MALTAEQVKELKRQLSGQIKNLSPEQREQAQKQINEMSAEALELMLKQQTAQGQEGKPQKSVFRMIVDGEIPSKRIDENKDAIAVVSKRAVSRGHVLVIPRKAVDDARKLPAGALSLAKKIAQKMPAKLKARSTEIQTSSAFGEAVVNVMPVYDKQVNVNSEAYEAGEKELDEVYSLLRVIKKQKKEKIKIRTKTAEAQVVKLPRRIP